MDVAKHVIDTFFKDISNPLVRHHLDSYYDFISTKIPRYIHASNPIKLLLADGRGVRVYIGGKAGNKLNYTLPVDDEGFAIYPHMCRLENKSYSFKIHGTIEIEYEYSETDIETKTFDDIFIAEIPLMLKSSLCYLRNMNHEELYKVGECNYELGGYFIIDGQERVLLTQESLGSNMFYAKKRTVLKVEDPTRTTVEKDTSVGLDSTKGENYEYVAGINSASEDGTIGPYPHVLLLGPKNTSPSVPSDIAKVTDFSTYFSRLLTLKLPGFLQAVPALSVFRALGITSDRELYDIILHGVDNKNKTIYDSLFTTIVISHDRYLKKELLKESDQTQDINLLVLKRQTRTRSAGSVYINLYSKMFPHCEIGEGSASTLYKRKAYLLGHMVRMLMDVELGITENSDRDHFKFKRLDAGGDLCFQEFRRIYKDVSKNMKLRLDQRVEFEKNMFKGKELSNLVNEDGLRIFWRHHDFMNQFTKSFKGMWGGNDGVSQVLSRFSYLGTVAHMRRVNLMIDKGSKQLPARRIHCSSWGLMCPTDNPDGGNVGLIKSMAIFSSISTQIPHTILKKYITDEKNFIPLTSIHPSNWNPIWTRVYLNSDLIGVITAGMEQFHKHLLEERRTQKFDMLVSLCWNRTANEYVIFTDAGRISRVVYREGIKSENIQKLKSWNSMVSSSMDYIDAQETESLRISMSPFNETSPSEIHGTMIFSPSASVNPASDHNQAPRNMFSCQQVKQACSWFNTAFNKRFDTIATHLHSPQSPITQTWTSPHIIGGMPYGENTIVALAIYSGYNQEDSILVNGGSLKRGMFKTSYYHSYDVSEEMLDPETQTHTIFANIVMNSKYRETVVRDAERDYSLLDGDGIIRVGSHVTAKTVLVGIVSPQSNEEGQVVRYVDVSSMPKRDQLGIVDSIYRYVKDNVQCVKIRVCESRSPTIGDKFSARHGQKGTCGIIIPEEDMPYNADGIRPDLVVNPHAFPSRMTIGMFIESIASKIGVHLGTTVDTTAFTTNNKIGDMKDILVQLGYHPYGHEVLYNGFTGEMIQSEIFMGPVYYLRSKLMTADKINYRSTGPKNNMTKQPLEGRASGGGLRIGEMERDGLLSHGVSAFIHESITKRSDGRTFLFQPETGLLETSEVHQIENVDIPHSMGLFVKELESMHIQVKLTGSSSVR
jgi:DNA-directed RNA polymerase II subunit RPB2